MYALLITFESTIPLADLQQPFDGYADALNEVPGLMSKTWLHEGTTLGGFHLFESQEAADDYLSSALAQGLMATEGFTDFATRGFDVLTTLSAKTGVGDLAPLAG